MRTQQDVAFSLHNSPMYEVQISTGDQYDDEDDFDLERAQKIEAEHEHYRELVARDRKRYTDDQRKLSGLPVIDPEESITQNFERTYRESRDLGERIRLFPFTERTKATLLLPDVSPVQGRSVVTSNLF